MIPRKIVNLMDVCKQECLKRQRFEGNENKMNALYAAEVTFDIIKEVAEKMEKKGVMAI